MPLLSEKDSAYLREEFAKQLVNPVRLVMFTQEKAACQYCRETEQIVREVAGLSDRIEVEVHNFIADGGKAKEYDIARIPAIAVIGEKDYGVRFYGIPSGYEFTTLIEDIMAIAQGKSGLSDATREAVAALTEPVHVQVFITPTCPYCPRAVRLAHQLAIESDLIRGDMVEAIEFPQSSPSWPTGIRLWACLVQFSTRLFPRKGRYRSQSSWPGCCRLWARSARQTWRPCSLPRRRWTERRASH